MVNSLKTKLCCTGGGIYGGGAFMVFNLLFMNFKDKHWSGRKV